MQLRGSKQFLLCNAQIKPQRQKFSTLSCFLNPRRFNTFEPTRVGRKAQGARAQRCGSSWNFFRFPYPFSSLWLSTSFSTCGTNLVVGIESSCDETAVSIVSSDCRVISSVTASQWAQQIEHSGVYPLVAARCHEKCIQTVFDQAVETACNKGVLLREVDAVAVSAGPGLGPCLSIGLQFAKNISQYLSKPLVAVNHLEAHAMVARLTRPEVDFPFLALIVSGGHTELWLAKAVGDYVVIGDTLDDAMGEAFDKVARMLQIPQSLEKEEAGGAAVERLARMGSCSEFSFPIPMESSSSCDFSFSGLKSSVRRLLQLQSKEKENPEGIYMPQLAADVCFSFQETAICHVEKRIVKAFAYLASEASKSSSLSPLIALNEVPVRHLVVGGGVACNSELRSRLHALGSLFGVKTVFPPPEHCSDNAVMVAWTGCEKYRLGICDSSQIVYQPRWPVGPKVDFFLDPKEPTWKSFNDRYKSHRRMLRLKKKSGDNRRGTCNQKLYM